MGKVHHLVSGAGMGAALCWAVAGEALAQPTGASAEPGRFLEEIIVTARKREEGTQDIPVAVSAFAADELDRRSVQTVEDLTSLVPNLVIDPVTVSASGAAIYLRGIGVQDIDRTFNPAVQVLIDGVTFGSSIANQMLTVVDVERIEVLRGPQGTLFGANAIGGLINVARKRASHEFGAAVEVTLGDDDRSDVEASIQGSLVPDLLAGRLFVSKLENDGQFTNDFDGRSRGFQDFLIVSPSLLFTPSENFELSVAYDYYKDESDWGLLQNRANDTELLCLGFLLPGAQLCEDPNRDLETISADYDTFMEVTVNAATVSATYTDGPYTFESITGFSDIEERKQTDFDGVSEQVFASIQPVDEIHYSQEFRLNYEHSDAVSFLGGVYAAYTNYEEGANSLFIFDLFGLPPDTIEVVYREQDTLAFGAFVTGNWQINDAWRLSAGGRWTYEEKDFVWRNGFNTVGGGFYPDAPGFVNDVPGKDSWTQFTPRVALEYRLNDDVLTYLSYAQGFKSGGFNGRGTSDETIGPYDPEVVDTYEIGLKSEWFDNRLRVNVAAFYSDYQDKQEETIRQSASQVTITTVDNAGEVTVQGIEVEWAWVPPLEGLTLSGTLGYLDAEYDEFDFNQVNVAEFLEMRRAPEWQYSLTGQYETRVGDGSLSGLVSYRWSDDYESHLGPRFDGGGEGPLWNDPRGTVDSVGLLEASVAYGFRLGDTDLEVRAYGKNLTDEVFYNGFTAIANLWSLSSVTPGRTWGVSLRADF